MNAQHYKPSVIPPGGGRSITVIGMPITVKLSAAETDGGCFIFESTTAPGDGVPPHVHSREDEILEVLEGGYEVVIGEDRFQASAGTIVYFPRDIVHAFTNTGKGPATYRVVVTPGANFDKFFAELSSLPTDLPPDMAKVMEIFDRYGLPIVTPDP